MSKLKGKARLKNNKKKKNQAKNSFFLRRKRLLDKIVKWDAPILHETCSSVEPDEDISEIIKEMKDILKATDSGLGIAAPQIGVSKRIFVTRSSVTSDDISVFINASITDESQKRETRGEGCLSYPGVVSVIERPSEITLEYENEKFEVCTKKLKGLDACVACHEHDHTVGICLVGSRWREEKDTNAKATTKNIKR